MIYTVTLNPSLDYVVQLSELKQGHLNRTDSECIITGGKGVNVSKVLKELNVDCVATGFAAGFTGNHLKGTLNEQGIYQDFIMVSNGLTRINVKVKEINTGVSGIGQICETEINANGPVISDMEVRIMKGYFDRLKADDILILSGSVPKGVSDCIYKEIVENANERNAKTVVDAAGKLLINSLEARPFLIKPNKDELVDIFGVKIDSLDEVIRYGTELKKMGAKNVLVSLGGDGAVLIADDGRIYKANAPKGQVVNSVGAGDSMVAGFVAGYIKNDNDYEKALQLGTAAGSATAFSRETAVREQIDSLLELVEIETII